MEMLEERSGVIRVQINPLDLREIFYIWCLPHMLIFQDREENSVGAADGWLELHDPILQKQLL